MSRLMEMAQQANSIAILGHIRPDGDCVGSCLAICNYLLEQYPERPSRSIWRSRRTNSVI